MFLLGVNAKCNTNGILVDYRSLTHIVKDELKFEDFETNNYFIELVDENRESNIALKRGNTFKGHEWQNVQLNFVQLFICFIISNKTCFPCKLP